MTTLNVLRINLAFFGLCKYNGQDTGSLVLHLEYYSDEVNQKLMIACALLLDVISLVRE